MKRQSIVCLCMLIYAVMPLGAMASQYQITNLRSLVDEPLQGAEMVNNQGQMLGWSVGYFLAWDKEGNKCILAPTAKISEVTDLNNLGSIVGIRRSDDLKDSAVIRYADGTIVELPRPLGDNYVHALALNDTGVVLGRVGALSDPMTTEVVLWNTNSGTMQTIFSEPDVALVNADISNTGYAAWTAGRTVGTSMYGEIYRWDSVNGVRKLSSPFSDFRHSVYSVNDHGVAVGFSGDHAVMWLPTGEVVDLGLGRAEYINNNGQIVGSRNNRAVLWNQDGTVTELPNLPGLELSRALAINDLGQIVGQSIGEEEHYAVLWQPVPEPTSLLALAAGVAGLVIRRRK